MPFSALRPIGSIGMAAAAMALLVQCGESPRTGTAGAPAKAIAEKSAPVDFNLDARPILSDRCFACHGPDAAARKAGLRLDKSDEAISELASGVRAIVPGDPGHSEAVRRMRSNDPTVRMPPPESNLSISPEEIAILERWIEEGAEYKPHWSFIPVPTLDEIERGLEPAVSPVDQFVNRRMAEQGLEPQPPADRETLVRRLSFDLTGLPPKPAVIDAFLSDESPNAAERLVDRLLASERYGERMAADWMDLSRFSDTHGYQADFYRPAWRWRDWVIDAYNRNMPYDEFLTLQIAGDLMPDADRESILATGFNRNHAQNAEGGIVNEEFRVEYAADRVNTLGKGILGLTLECARCHDHKYDPISQKEFYQLFAFFNNVDEAGQITWSQTDLPPPTLLLPTVEEEQRLNGLRDEIERLEASRDALRKGRRAAFEAWLGRLAAGEETIPKQPAGLAGWFPLEDATNEAVANLVENGTPGRIVDPVTQQLYPSPPVPAPGRDGEGLRMDGDSMLDFPGLGKYFRADPFSIGLWIKVPKDLKNGVIFHGNRGGIIYSFKGYQVSVEDGRFEVRIAHSFPYASVHLLSRDEVPREEWIHLALTHDGSGRAAGVRLYLNGLLLEMETKRDNLYKEIVFVRDGIDTNLRVGARWRSKGFTGGLVDEIQVYNRELPPPEAAMAAGLDPLADLMEDGQDSLTDTEIQGWHEYYLANIDPDYPGILEELRAARHEFNAIEEQVDHAMVMDEMPEPRQAFVLERGAYDAHGEPVDPGTPGALPAFNEKWPRNRLGLAKWLTARENPLTARVVADRLWRQFFGKGLVNTPEDFGSQGSLPTHPRLLDWLAAKLMDLDWDIKALQKIIVLSDTYQRSSAAPPEDWKADPENRWLARGPSKRLSAEMLRDQALAASGLLTGRIGGPSVKPYQPEGLWSFGSVKNYEQSTGPDLYRRSLYTFWKRTVPPPTMNIFDAPERSVCVVRREKTNTPLQALALMNDPQFTEAAKMLAVRAIGEAGGSAGERIRHIFRLLTARWPNGEELSELAGLHEGQRAAMESEPVKAEGWLNAGDSELAPERRNAETAALAVTAAAVMNADASVMLR